jgi:hypothetical protein
VRWPVGEEYGFPEELDPLVEVVRRAGIVLRLTPLRPLGASKGEQAHFVALRIGIHSGRQAALAPLRKLS